MNGWRAFTDTELIFLALAAMYLWECVCWLPREAVCLSSAWGRYKFLRSLPPFQNERGRVVLASPTPFASSFICEPWPIVMDSRVILTPTGDGAKGEQTPRTPWLSYDDVRSVATDGRAVLINAKRITSLATEAHAKFVAQKLRAVCEADENDRPQVIEAILDETTGVAAISKRLSVFQKTVFPLKISCTVFALYTFIVGPLLYYVPMFAWWHVAWFYLAGFLAWWLFLVFQCHKVRGASRNDTRGARLWHLAMLLLSPASAMRAAEALSRDLLAFVEPLAAAAALCSADDFVLYAEATLRSALCPACAEQAIEDMVARDARSWFNNQREVRLKRAIRCAGLDPEVLLQQPDAAGDAASYCPRCLRLYTINEGSCSECPGVFLRTFTRRARIQTIDATLPEK